MNPSQLDIAKQLAAHPAFKWRSGMLHAEIVTECGELAAQDFERMSDGDVVPHGRVPVLDDGPTKGALLELVREKTGEAGAYVLPICGTFADGRRGPICGWEVLRIGTNDVAPTEGEALALAILAMPILAVKP